MVNNIIKILVIIFIFAFLTVVFKYYFSEKNVNLVINNRNNLETKVLKETQELPILQNDTSDVIEFNSEFKTPNKKIFKRNFWELFK